jgi:predicted ATPase
MPISNEVRRLGSKWDAGTGWPKRLDWLEIKNIRGWEGQRFELRFPIMAVVGENGSGKSTILQAAASLYRSPGAGLKDQFAADYFPETPWDSVREAEIRAQAKEGDTLRPFAVRKLTDRWRNNQRLERNVVFLDLSRIQPLSARVGYTKLANPGFKELSADSFDPMRLARYSQIMGRDYDIARMAMTDADAKRPVSVIAQHGKPYSGFHSGAGEITMAELIQADLPKYSLVLIDEIESSLHPRVQRRLISDLANKCRELDLQVILTTHSPYVLDELPPDARAQILRTHTGRREIVYGVSPAFAMSKMDDVPQIECDLYVEDPHAETMLTEILAAHSPGLVSRCRTIPFGAASVGRALGEMVAGQKFPDASCVFLDGDQGSAVGCINLPGEDSPERVVFAALAAQNWLELSKRIGRAYPDTVDACARAMTLSDSHDWVRSAATALVVGGDTLWQAMCAEWASKILTPDAASEITQPVSDALDGIKPAPVSTPVPASVPDASSVGATPDPAQNPSGPTESAQLSVLSPDAAQE